MLRLLMGPANWVCDAIHLEDEHERGLIRQLVNGLLLSAMAVPVFWIAWRLVG